MPSTPEYHRAYSARRRAIALRAGRCMGHPKRKVIHGTTKCIACHRYNRKYCRAYSVKYKAALKLEIISHYCRGRIRCQCKGCRTVLLCFLQLDHIKGGNGVKHRAKVKDMYAWIKRMGFPKGFQVYCANCNSAKGVKARCPMHGRKH